MGIPLVSALLEENGISSRIVRFLDDPYDVPEEIGDTCDAVMWGNPPIEERMAHMRALADTYPDFFETARLAPPRGSRTRLRILRLAAQRGRHPRAGAAA